MKNTLCIYHANCADGFGAAWAYRRANPFADFHAAGYGSAPPDVTGLNVVIVDFSYKRPVLLDMAKQAKSILILDHHKSAQQDLIDLPHNITAVFDMERSGAMITWQTHFPDEEPPALIKHIQDRDLWRFELSHTKEIMAAVFSHPYTFKIWDNLMAASPELIIHQGEAILRKHNKDIQEISDSNSRYIKILGTTVPVCNAPHTMASDIGHILGKDQPYAATYQDTADCRKFSLRSAPDGADVSQIAQRFGGGGHKNAAGFSVPRHHPLAKA